MALNLLIFPRQRLKRVQLEVANLSDAVMKLYSLDLSGLRWAECREGVLARLPGGASPEMLVRIPSAKLECTALLVYVREDGNWGYRLCWKGTVEDAFALRPEEASSATPEQHTARLARRFPKLDREALLSCLTQDPPEGSDAILTDFLNIAAPWAEPLLDPDRLAPFRPLSSNAPDRFEKPPAPRPSIDNCLPLLTGVRALRQSWSFPKSLLYILFPKKRPRPEDIPFAGWTGQEVEAILSRFCQGELDRLELNFALRGEETRVRRLNQTVSSTYAVTLELIREKGRCVCLFLDGQDAGMYRLIADRNAYMETDSKDLAHTLFHGQDIQQYVVFEEPFPEAIPREVSYLLARLEQKDSVLSPTKRMGVWSREGTYSNTAADRERYQQRLAIWRLA